MEPLITSHQLKSAKRILYMTHLALGDFVYQRAFLRALIKAYPQLQLDIWIDDCRTKSKAWHAGRNNTLMQWLGSEEYIHKAYSIASSSIHRKEMIQEARSLNYDLIVFNATHRAGVYAKYARQISASAYIVGTAPQTTENPLSRWWYFRRINKLFREPSYPVTAHISEIYHQRFQSLLGINLPNDKRVAPIEVCSDLREKANEFVTHPNRVTAQVIFINHLSTTEKRDLPWAKLKDLLHGLYKQNEKRVFIVNTPPAQYEKVSELLKQDKDLQELVVKPFTASQFAELPALIEASDLVISVETAVMHIAASLSKPQIVLMRESAKAWAPVGEVHFVLGGNRVDTISVDEILSRVAEHYPR